MQKKEYINQPSSVNVTKCKEAHMKAFEKWPYGRVLDSWTDEHGNICIKYMTGKWFHYKITDTGEVQWW